MFLLFRGSELHESFFEEKIIHRQAMDVLLVYHVHLPLDLLGTSTGSYLIRIGIVSHIHKSVFSSFWCSSPVEKCYSHQDQSNTSKFYIQHSEKCSHRFFQIPFPSSIPQGPAHQIQSKRYYGNFQQG